MEIKKPFTWAECTVDGVSLTVTSPIKCANGFFRGAKITVRNHQKTKHFTFRTVYPVDYDNTDGFGGMDIGDDMRLSRVVEGILEILERAKGNLDKAVVKSIAQVVKGENV